LTEEKTIIIFFTVYSDLTNVDIQMQLKVKKMAFIKSSEMRLWHQ